MTDLKDRLERLGLSQYLEAFIAEGFDTWETVIDITESDLNFLKVKLGHRRKLQRAIAQSRGQPSDRALLTDDRRVSSIDGSYRSDESGAEPRDTSALHAARHNTGSAAPGTGSGTKRKYRRHPKPDPNAPERPPSAYVIFSNLIREELKGQDLSFTEIAKVVGERWQILSPDARDSCEQQANAAKEKYYSELAQYKKTSEYIQYQEYLTEFKLKHGTTGIEGKRSKIESESSGTTIVPSTSQDNYERIEKKPNHPGAEGYFERAVHSGSSPVTGSMNAPSTTRRLPSSSTSPGIHSTNLGSPVKVEHPSSEAASPKSGNPQEGNRERLPPQRITIPVEARTRDVGFVRQSPTARPGHHALASDGRSDYTPSSSGYSGYLSRQLSQTSPPVPQLVHHDSAVSSDSGGVSLPTPSSSLLPTPEAAKNDRILPHPIIGNQIRIPMDARPLVALAGPPPSNITLVQDPQRASNFSALLRATEMAREAQMRGSDNQEDKAKPP